MPSLEHYRKKVGPEVVQLLHEIHEGLNEENPNRAPFWAMTDHVFSRINNIVTIDPTNLTVFESDEVSKRRIEFRIIHLILPILNMFPDELKSNPEFTVGILHGIYQTLEEEQETEMWENQRITMDAIIEALQRNGGEPIPLFTLIQRVDSDWFNISSLVDYMRAKGKLSQDNTFGLVRLPKTVHDH